MMPFLRICGDFINQKSTSLIFADYIIPASENNAIFIMTNFIETDQNRSQCSESTALPEAACRIDLDCQNRPHMPNANGRWTGRCILPNDNRTIFNSSLLRSRGVCEMQGKSPENSFVHRQTESRCVCVCVCGFRSVLAHQVNRMRRINARHTSTLSLWRRSQL